jgi:hypothetical protein
LPIKLTDLLNCKRATCVERRSHRRNFSIKNKTELWAAPLWLNIEFTLQSLRNLVTNIQADTVGTCIHLSAPFVRGPKLRLKQVWHVILTYANTVVDHWQRDGDLFYWFLFYHRVNSYFRLREWELNCIAEKVQKDLFNSHFVDFKLHFFTKRQKLNFYRL